MTLNSQIGFLMDFFLQFSANGGIHALGVACNTEIYALDIALGVIRRGV